MINIFSTLQVTFMSFTPRSLKPKLLREVDRVSWTSQISTSVETNQSQTHAHYQNLMESKAWFMKKFVSLKN
jgi:predicted NUDIX family NTP pyrophosphohydrolase